MCVRVCACVRVCVRACVRVCVRAREDILTCMCVRTCVLLMLLVRTSQLVFASVYCLQAEWVDPPGGHWSISCAQEGEWNRNKEDIPCHNYRSLCQVI